MIKTVFFFIKFYFVSKIRSKSFPITASALEVYAETGIPYFVCGFKGPSIGNNTVWSSAQNSFSLRGGISILRLSAKSLHHAKKGCIGCEKEITIVSKSVSTMEFAAG